MYATTLADGSVVDTHVRRTPGHMRRAEELLGGLATASDRIWPADRWPPMTFEEGLAVGAVGGHGGVRYAVEEIVAGRRVVFRFTPENSFAGCHSLEIEPAPGGVTWRHTLRVERPARPTMRLTLPVHDAVIEDLFDQVAAAMEERPCVRRGLAPRVVAVRYLRAALATEGAGTTSTMVRAAAGLGLRLLALVPSVAALDAVRRSPLTTDDGRPA